MYYIYHIPGVKIGVSIEPKVRCKDQGYSNFEILEQYSNIKKVSKREIELQKEYGYKVDSVPYYITRQLDSSHAGKIGGKIGGLKGGKIMGPIIAQHNKKTLSIPILAYKIDGTFVGEFYSISECSRVLEIAQGNISGVLNPNRKLYKTKGYTFKYKL